MEVADWGVDGWAEDIEKHDTPSEKQLFQKFAREHTRWLEERAGRWPEDPELSPKQKQQKRKRLYNAEEQVATSKDARAMAFPIARPRAKPTAAVQSCNAVTGPQTCSSVENKLV